MVEIKVKVANFETAAASAVRVGILTHQPGPGNCRGGDIPRLTKIPHQI
jgi:hypothetical protein